MTIYYNPEKYGLELLGELHLQEEFYSFDLVVVWQHIETGQVYYEHDSGCSCPGEFDWLVSIEELTKLPPGGWKELQSFILERSSGNYVSVAEAHAFVKEMQRAAA